MPFHDSIVPAYLQMLGTMSAGLKKAEAYAEAKNIEPAVLLGTRLFPDMLPLSRQVQLLERILGVLLLDRTSRSVRLTPAGRAFPARSGSRPWRLSRP